MDSRTNFFSFSILPSYVEAEAVDFSRFRFCFHRKRTASTASSFRFRFHLPGRNTNGTRTTWMVLQVVSAFIPWVSSRPLGMSLPRTSWVTLHSPADWSRTFFRWGLAPSPNWVCGATEQTSVFHGLLHLIHMAIRNINDLPASVPSSVSCSLYC